MMLKSSVNAFATRRWLVSAVLTAALAVPSAAAWTAAPPPLPAGTDSGAQLNRAREYMEQQRVAQQIEEDQERQKAKVETEAQTPGRRRSISYTKIRGMRFAAPICRLSVSMKAWCR